MRNISLEPLFSGQTKKSWKIRQQCFLPAPQTSLLAMLMSTYTRAANAPQKQGTNCWAEGTPSCQILLFYGILFRKLPLISGSGTALGGKGQK